MGRARSSPTPAPMQGRRATLRQLTAGILAGAVSWISVGNGKERQELICVNSGNLSEAENRQRKLDNYTEKSLDPDKTCSGCRFFTTAADPTACGKCEIFNGPANPQGKCDDWTARPVRA